MAEAERQDDLNTLLPWHSGAWARVARMREGGRLPHALLLSGRAGMGKFHFAQVLGRALLCAQPTADGLACGTCAACTLLNAGTHPDLRICRVGINEKTGKEKTEIAIDQVREIVNFLTLKAHHDGWRVILLHEADRLNRHAANALLKTLEEPPAETLLVLVTARPARLMPTILSRCQQLRLQPDPARVGEATSWLEARLDSKRRADAALLLTLAGGAPLAALALAEQGDITRREAMLDDLGALARGAGDPVGIAEDWLKFGLRESLYWLYTWLADMARLRTAGEPPFVMNPDHRTRLATMAADLDPRGILEQVARVTETMQLIDTQVNPQLLLEDSLLGWTSINLRGRSEKKYNNQ